MENQVEPVLFSLKKAQSQKMSKITLIEGTLSPDSGFSKCFKFYNNSDSKTTIVATGGNGGGFEGPSYIYMDLAEYLEEFNLSMIVLDSPHKVGPATKQLYKCLKVLEHFKKTDPLILMGWSMGGAVIIQLAHQMKTENYPLQIKRLISLAGQTADAKLLKNLDIPITVFHGSSDPVLDVKCAYIYQSWAQNSTLLIIEHADHHFQVSYGEQNSAAVFTQLFYKQLRYALAN
jgi:alpha-beta hydrolase superfamily lysophospholipase